MGTRELRLEELLSRVVCSEAGRPIGRIDEIVAEPEGDEYLVRGIVLGELGLLPRLFRFLGQLPTFRTLGLGGRYRQRLIPWDWLDFTNPHEPRFHSPTRGKER